MREREEEKEFQSFEEVHIRHPSQLKTNLGSLHCSLLEMYYMSVVSSFFFSFPLILSTRNLPDCMPIKNIVICESVVATGN